MVRKKACIFISGYGSNLKSLIHRSRENNFPINVSLVISDKFNAKGILHAKKNSIPYLIVNTKKRNFENLILKKIKRYKISVIFLAGYMKIISKNFIFNFRNKIVNIHPSLLPKFKGLNTYQRILKQNEKQTGCTVHYVNEELDGGEIILQGKVPILPDDDIISLTKAIQRQEYALLPSAIEHVKNKYQK